MATQSSPIPGIIRRLPTLETRTVLAAVKDIKTLARREARHDVGSDNLMSNVGKKGARLGARDNYRRGATTAIVKATPAGPWAWMNTGTGAHLIGVGRSNRRTGNYAAVRFKRGPQRLHIGEEGNRMGPVFHPGPSGKGTWRRVRRLVPAVIRRNFQAELARFVHG